MRRRLASRHLTFLHRLSNVVAGGSRPPGFIPPRRCPVQSCRRRATDAGTDDVRDPSRRNATLCLEVHMRYRLKQIHCRPWMLSGLSLKLIESHYENNYGGALRRLNAITEQLESLDFSTTPPYVVNSLKREQLTALNSTLLHELYFASMGGEGKVTDAMSEALTHDFGSVQRWRTEFSAMGYALGGGSG